MGRRVPLPSIATRRAETPLADRGKAPLANLCNQLVVNRAPDLRPAIPELGGLSPCRLPLPALPRCAHACTRFGTEPSAGAPDSPKASPTSSGDAVGAARTCWFHDQRCPGGPPQIPSRIRNCNLHMTFQPTCKPRGLDPDAPCRIAHSCRGLSPTRPNDTKNPFHRRHTKCRRFPGPKRLPPMSPFNIAPCWR
jgi:hypothetical protein